MDRYLIRKRHIQSNWELSIFYLSSTNPIIMSTTQTTTATVKVEPTQGHQKKGFSDTTSLVGGFQWKGNLKFFVWMPFYLFETCRCPHSRLCGPRFYQAILPETYNYTICCIGNPWNLGIPFSGIPIHSSKRAWPSFPWSWVDCSCNYPFYHCIRGIYSFVTFGTFCLVWMRRCILPNFSLDNIFWSRRTTREGICV